MNKLKTIKILIVIVFSIIISGGVIATNNEKEIKNEDNSEKGNTLSTELEDPNSFIILETHESGIKSESIKAKTVEENSTEKEIIDEMINEWKKTLSTDLEDPKSFDIPETYDSRLESEKLRAKAKEDYYNENNEIIEKARSNSIPETEESRIRREKEAYEREQEAIKNEERIYQEMLAKNESIIIASQNEESDTIRFSPPSEETLEKMRLEKEEKIKEDLKKLNGTD